MSTCQKTGFESAERTDLEQTEVEISLSARTFGRARVVLNVRDCLKLARVLRVEHLEIELVRVDEDGKVVPRRLIELRFE